VSGPADLRRVAWLAAVLLAGCTAGGVAREELAQPEIAILYWDYLEARDRLKAQEASRRGGPARPGRLGVADLGDLGRLLGDPGADASIDQRYPGHLSLVDPATGAVRPIEAAPPGAVPLAWRSDHGALLFAAAGRRHGVQLYEYLVEAQEARPVTVGRTSHTRGDYGPEGRFAVVAEPGGGGSRVELTAGVDRDRRVVFSGAPVYDVRWSPRGDMLLLAVIDPARRDLQGRAARMLFGLSPEAPVQGWPPGPGSMLKALGRGRDPVFSADGEWIVYSARVGDGWRLRRMRVGGGGKLPVGRGSRDEIEPAVSPDGSLVAYVSEEGGQQRLFVRRVDGSGDRLLLPDGAVARPVW
jgi:hypothetical protein